jgi:hypothetical protein
MAIKTSSCILFKVLHNPSKTIGGSLKLVRHCKRGAAVLTTAREIAANRLEIQPDLCSYLPTYLPTYQHPDNFWHCVLE